MVGVWSEDDVAFWQKIKTLLWYFSKWTRYLLLADLSLTLLDERNIVFNSFCLTEPIKFLFWVWSLSWRNLSFCLFPSSLHSGHASSLTFCAAVAPKARFTSRLASTANVLVKQFTAAMVLFTLCSLLLMLEDQRSWCWVPKSSALTMSTISRVLCTYFTLSFVVLTQRWYASK